ncbi:MAG: penicillin acylase family protein, partial [Sphingomicrobium sp.]
QFFIYQGFNRHVGWIHTSSGVDNIDEFSYEVRARRYRYGKTWRPLAVKPVTIRFRLSSGGLAGRTFTTFATHRGPIVRRDGKRWVAFAMMDRPVEALQQSFGRTKARDLAGFMAIADRHRANSSNATVFADDKGAIAVLSPQFMPIRSARYDYLKTVDGSEPVSDWRGLHAPSRLPNTIRPATGWAFNTNDWLYSAAGPASPKPGDFPAYLDKAGANYRTIHATRLLSGSSGWTIERLRDAAYDPAQPGFEILPPMLVQAFDALPAGDPRRQRLAGPVTALRGWEGRWSANSVSQTLANFWGVELVAAVERRNWPQHANQFRRIESLEPAAKLDAFDRAVARLTRDFGDWRIEWGEVNRFQRLSGAIDARFDDSKPSVAVPFASNRWGSLASMGAQPGAGTKRWYGTTGNSFIAIVEFGPKPRAIALTAGGLSNDPASRHFADQMARYPGGALRSVYFDAADLAGHIERTYRPGERSLKVGELVRRPDQAVGRARFAEQMP